MEGQSPEAPEQMEAFLRKLCHEALSSLTELNIVKMTDSTNITPNPASLIMARHMVPYSAMEAIVNLSFDSFELRKLLHVLSM